MVSVRRIAVELERTIYVVAGLPIALRAQFGGAGCQGACRDVRRAFARWYWRPQKPLEWIELVAGIVLAPVAVPLAALWFASRNGPVIARRDGKGVFTQFTESIGLYFSAGIVGPWYYILSLHRDGARRAPTFLQRCETKWGVFALLRPEDSLPLSDKVAFAEHCQTHGVRCATALLRVDAASPVSEAELPDHDLFVKPVSGRGGKGAERWDLVGYQRWSNGVAELHAPGLVERLNRLALDRPMLVQSRLAPHPRLEPLTSGALPTVRALTCLDEQGTAEVVAAVFRMSIGANRTVDNIHAGGLACRVSLDDGVLGPASNLGADARLGWHDTHPTTGARIAGTQLPCWDEVKALAVKAHEAFPEKIVVGWDIAILADGPIVIEGNGSPDMDLMQRFMETGFCHEHRFGELLAHHLNARGFVD